MYKIWIKKVEYCKLYEDTWHSGIPGRLFRGYRFKVHLDDLVKKEAIFSFTYDYDLSKLPQSRIEDLIFEIIDAHYYNKPIRPGVSNIKVDRI